MTMGVSRGKWLFLTTLICMVSPYTSALTTTWSSSLPRVAVVGGGISGLVVGHVLQQSGRYSVELFEAESRVGGNVRSINDPFAKDTVLNIGHATHLGMFLNLRLMLRHLGVEEWPVGRGPNDKPGLFRMLSVTTEGDMFQPPISSVTSPSVWWEAFVFYYYSYLEPERRLDDFLASHNFSKRFMDIVYWAMATFEFDKHREEAGEYALGTARALLITQVFFQYLLSDAFEGSLPPKIDDGLRDELSSRISKNAPSSMSARLKDRLSELKPLGSYFTANYRQAMEKLADGAGKVHTNAAVSNVSKDKSSGRIIVESTKGEIAQVDAIVFATQPSSIVDILDEADFPSHMTALQQVESGAVGVKIVRAKDLPFRYPPNRASEGAFNMMDPPPILGIFDISELSTSNKGQPIANSDVVAGDAGWLSVAYPIYQNKTLNYHKKFLDKVPCADETVYPWTRATSTFPGVRRQIVALQGQNKVYITGHTLTSVNKASELQMVNALYLCYRYFDVTPPWKDFFPTPPLPDCNDDDAFLKANSPFEAFCLATKSLVGSFLLTGVVAKLGASFFD